MNLYFVPAKLPRSMTRQEWVECNRWRRVAQKQLREETDRQISDLQMFGSTMPEGIRKDVIDRLVNPPMLLGPHMNYNNNLNEIRPGMVTG